MPSPQGRYNNLQIHPPGHVLKLCMGCQGEDPDYMWAITVMWFWIKGFLGCVGVAISIAWVLQVILYVFISPPASPFLNSMFTRLDRAFGLFGTLAFAIFCFYLIGAAKALCASMRLMADDHARHAAQQWTLAAAEK